VHTIPHSVNLKGISYFGYLGVDKRIIINCVINKWAFRMWYVFMRLAMGTSGGFLWVWYEPYGFMKRGEYLDHLSLKKGSSPYSYDAENYN
jgi:hypothetical protein